MGLFPEITGKLSRCIERIGHAIGIRRAACHACGNGAASALGTSAMSLRFRLTAPAIVALLGSLAVGSAVTLLNASRSLCNEMQSALTVARQSVDNMVPGISASIRATRSSKCGTVAGEVGG